MYAHQVVLAEGISFSPSLVPSKAFFFCSNLYIGDGLKLDVMGICGFVHGQLIGSFFLDLFLYD